MKTIKRQDSFGQEVELHYSDLGKGKPVVLIHGWPLSMEMWEYQLNALISSGHRVIKYDRRGFGKSSKPWDGYDYDTFSEDLKAILDQLDLNDVTLVGFSMGGGEVVRYMNKFNGSRVERIVLLGSVTPFLLKTPDNPDGVDKQVFEEILGKISHDRIDFLEGFGKQFFGISLVNHPVSAPLLDYYKILGSHASQRSTMECVHAYSETDFTQDLKNIKVPTLIIHGSGDNIVPIGISGDKTAAAISDCKYIVYDGAPHGFFYTHKDRLNEDLVSFLSRNLSKGVVGESAPGNW